ncbi:MAG: tol-pal system protein YbgF [Pseudomonadota bacterium]
MKIPYSLFAAILLAMGSLGMVGALSAAEKSLTMEQRLERLERILRNQSLSDIILQLQQLQQEVQQLRGEVELQNHTLDALNKRQRDLYLDIDQRLSRMQLGPAATTGSATSAGPTPPSSEAGSLTPEPQPQPAPVQAAAVSQPPDPKQESAAYQKAFNLLKQGRYKESISAFRGFLERYPGGQYEDNAQYWLGEASYVSRDFDTALAEFSKVVEGYPDSSKVPGALLKSGYIQYEKRNWSQARELFKRLQQEHAGGTEARLAVKRLERMDKEGH